MKLYVIKNSEGHYLTETLDYLSGYWNAFIFYDYELAQVYCSIDCKIYEWNIKEIDKGGVPLSYYN